MKYRSYTLWCSLVVAFYLSLSCENPARSKSEMREVEIVYMMQIDGRWEIITMDLEGGHNRILTNEGGQNPSFSPDGKEILFDSERNGASPNIYRMDINGENLRPLTTYGGFLPSYSPDGSQIAFTSARHYWLGIYIMDVDGENQRSLTDSLFSNNYHPLFSPDGSKIAFHSSRDGNQEIYLMDVDGSYQINLSNSKSDDHLGDFSPNGSKLFFWSERDGYDAIYNINLEEGELTKLSGDSGIYPNVSPDGKKVVFASWRGGNNSEIMAINEDGSDQTKLTETRDVETYPVFSIDGSQVIFHRAEPSTSGWHWNLYIMDSDGNHLFALTTQGGLLPSFRPR